MSEKVLGLANPYRVSQRFVNNNQRGSSYQEVWEGTKEAIDLQRLLVLPGFSWEIDPSEKPKYRLIVSAGDDGGAASPTEVITTFEVLGNSRSVALALAPAFQSIDTRTIFNLNAVANGEISYIEETATPKIAFPDPTNPATHAPYNNPLWQLYVNLIRMGHTEFQISEYSFRVTNLISNRYQTALAFNNVRKIYSSAQIEAEISFPTTFFKLSDVTNSVAPDPVSIKPFMTYGWLKQTPQSQSSGLKFQIVNEWWLNIWPTILYPLAT